MSVMLAYKKPEPAEAEPPFAVGEAIGPTVAEEAKKKRLLRIERAKSIKQVESAQQPEEPSETAIESTQSTQTIAIQASFYTAFCSEGCTGTTATGIDVSKSQYFEGRRIIAVDPNFIALGSTGILTLSNGESYSIVAQDTGGAIKGNRIDVLVASEGEAIALGRLTGTITLD